MPTRINKRLSTYIFLAYILIPLLPFNISPLINRCNTIPSKLLLRTQWLTDTTQVRDAQTAIEVIPPTNLHLDLSLDINHQILIFIQTSSPLIHHFLPTHLLPLWLPTPSTIAIIARAALPTSTRVPKRLFIHRQTTALNHIILQQWLLKAVWCTSIRTLWTLFIVLQLCLTCNLPLLASIVLFHLIHGSVRILGLYGTTSVLHAEKVLGDLLPSLNTSSHTQANDHMSALSATRLSTPVATSNGTKAYTRQLDKPLFDIQTSNCV